MSRTPRNEPCPCGSGSKYKKCCYLKEHKRWLAARQPPPEPPPSESAQIETAVARATQIRRSRGRAALQMLLGAAALYAEPSPPPRYQVSAEGRAVYLAHAAGCSACTATDDKLPGAERCGEGMRILIEALERA